MDDFTKKECYIISKRNYLDDYGIVTSKKIDMTLSGAYLYKYPFKLNNKYAIDRYPNYKEKNLLINSIRDKLNIDEKLKIIIGAGSNGIIQNICKSLITKGDNIVTPYLSFSQPEFAATSYNAETRRTFLNNKDRINFDNINNAIDNKTKLVYICNPNNPTGLIEKNDDIINLASKNRKTYFLIDESNIEFSDAKSILNSKIPGNILVLRSFSKVYGLSNLRIGYLICNNYFYEKYIKNVTINEFSGISCYAAYKSINRNFYKENVRKIIKEKQYIVNELKKLGIEFDDSFSNTLFTKNSFLDKAIEIFQNNDISVVWVIDQNNNLRFRIAIQKHSINKEFINRIKKINNLDKIMK